MGESSPITNPAKVTTLGLWPFHVCNEAPPSDFDPRLTRVAAQQQSSLTTVTLSPELLLLLLLFASLGLCLAIAIAIAFPSRRLASSRPVCGSLFSLCLLTLSFGFLTDLTMPFPVLRPFSPSSVNSVHAFIIGNRCERVYENSGGFLVYDSVASGGTRSCRKLCS
uniref:Uncharacterized protein n=1 Tax=Physcomitrium patens TaxID=3218 RepID=A0A7I4C5Y9_PHYPA